nr:MAG TPA: Proteolipid membrane potential modulator [Caudoviricetes sp.]
MRILLAILLPWLSFFTIGRPFAGVICFILQCTLIGWLPAAIWAAYGVSQYHTDKKIEGMLKKLESGKEGGNRPENDTVVNRETISHMSSDMRGGIVAIVCIIIVVYFGVYLGNRTDKKNVNYSDAINNPIDNGKINKYAKNKKLNKSEIAKLIEVKNKLATYCNKPSNSGYEQTACLSSYKLESVLENSKNINERDIFNLMEVSDTLSILCRVSSTPEEYEELYNLPSPYPIIKRYGWCYGEKNQSNVEMKWHQCNPNSN